MPSQHASCHSNAGQPFVPKVVAMVCNWCIYIGAGQHESDQSSASPANLRIIRLPCTGRIDFHLIVKALDTGADSVLISGCHPAHCHHSDGNIHAESRWQEFRELLESMGIDTRRIHLTWVSASESDKFRQVVDNVVQTTRELGPYDAYRQIITPSKM